MTTPREDSPVPDVNAYPYGHGDEPLFLTELGAKTFPASKARIVKQAQRDAERITPYIAGDTVTAGDIAPVKPVSLLTGTRDCRQVLHQIRALLVFACTMLAVLTLTAFAAASQLRDPRPGTVAEFPTPSAVTLSLSGDPALDYMAHVVLADGSERDVQLGSYLLDSPVRIILHANSPEMGETWCRIGLRGVLVASEASQNGGTATCEWKAS